MQKKLLMLPFLGCLFLFSGCKDDSSAVARVYALAGAISSQPNTLDGDYWIEVRSIDGDWIKVGLIFGFLGNQETCDRIAENLTTPDDYPGLERVYRCSRSVTIMQD